MESLHATKYIVALCICSLVAALFIYKTTYIQPTFFLLNDNVVNSALEESGLHGVISEAETVITDDGQITYIIRSQAKTYSDHVSPLEASEDPSTRWLIAGVTSKYINNERILFATFDHLHPDAQMKWDDWKEQIVFATLLYGCFNNEQEIYDIFSKMDIPERKKSISWNSEFSGGYCVISWTFSEASSTPEQTRHAHMTIRFYESTALYQRLQNSNLQNSK